jgi:hypothetical protein
MELHFVKLLWNEKLQYKSGDLYSEINDKLLQGLFKGEYDTNAIHFSAVNLIRQFKSTIGLVNGIHNFLILWISAMMLETETMAIISLFIMKSKSR